MTPCPSCGHVNDADATSCALCGRPLARPDGTVATPPPAPDAPAPVANLQPPPGFPGVHGAPPYAPPPIPIGNYQPIPLRPQQSTSSKVGQYFLGVMLGFLAAIISIYGLPTLSSSQFAGGNFALLGCLPGLAAFVGMIVCLSISKVRFIGYGLLTVIVGAPVIFFIGCIVILSGSGLYHP